MSSTLFAQGSSAAIARSGKPPTRLLLRSGEDRLCSGPGTLRESLWVPLPDSGWLDPERPSPVWPSLWVPLPDSERLDPERPSPVWPSLWVALPDSERLKKGLIAALIEGPRIPRLEIERPLALCAKLLLAASPS